MMFAHGYDVSHLCILSHVKCMQKGQQKSHKIYPRQEFHLLKKLNILKYITRLFCVHFLLFYSLC